MIDLKYARIFIPVTMQIRSKEAIHLLLCALIERKSFPNMGKARKYLLPFHTHRGWGTPSPGGLVQTPPRMGISPKGPSRFSKLHPIYLIPKLHQRAESLPSFEVCIKHRKNKKQCTQLTTFFVTHYTLTLIGSPAPLLALEAALPKHSSTLESHLERGITIMHRVPTP